MSTLSYRGINLDVVETVEYSKTPVHDSGNTYLYTTVRIRCRCILNEDAMAYVLAGRAAASAQGQEVFPATTDAAIRHVLAQPRGKLIYTDGQNLILSSPEPGNSVDCNNGPVCIQAPTVVAVIGAATWHVEVCYETYVNECAKFKDTVSALASHRWAMSEDISFQEFSTRTVKGRAIFKADRLAALGAYPDDFRGYLLHKCPDGFQRQNIQVTATEDGLGVDYVVVDKSQYGVIRAANVKKIGGYHRVRFARLSDNQIQLEALRSGGRLLSTVSSAIAQATGINAIFGIVGVKLSLVGNLMDQTINYFEATTPKLIHEIAVQVWGTSLATHGDLSAVAHRILSQRLGGNGPLRSYGMEITETRKIGNDEEASYVEVQSVRTSGVPAGVVGVVRGIGLGAIPFAEGPAILEVIRNLANGIGGDVPAQDVDINTNVQTFFPITFPPAPAGTASDLIANRIGPRSEPVVGGLPFSQDGGARGRILGRMTAAALADPCERPPAPVNVGGGATGPAATGTSNVFRDIPRGAQP